MWQGLLEISEDGVVKLLTDEAKFKNLFSHLEDGINPDSYKNIQHALLRNPGHATCILNPTAPHKDSDLNEFMHHSLILNKQSTTLPIKHVVMKDPTHNPQWKIPRTARNERSPTARIQGRKPI